jgi:3-oxoacyl-[acyl-carrier-protein] synthase-1
MAADRIVVTAVGIVTALGKGRDTNAQALRAGESGLRYPQFLDSIHAGEFLIGEVRQSNEDLKAALGVNPMEEGFTRTTLLAMTAMQDLVAGTDIDLLKTAPLAFINANTVGGMCEVEHLYPQFIAPGVRGSFTKYIDTFDCGESTEHTAAFFGLKPFMATISTACSSSGNALIVGARMIRQGLAQRAICGGCDAMSRFTLNGFNSLKNVDREPCRPFDGSRMGLNLGEGAGYLLLEKESNALARGAEIMAVFSGCSNTNDAYHPTAPPPDGAGAFRTMDFALEHAHLRPSDIDYINAHGTATHNNDVAEGRAIEQLWEGTPPPFSSTKPFTGHTLAAAGAVEAIFSIAALQEGFIAPNLNFSEGMEELSIRPTRECKEGMNLRHVLSNSFGFGGNNVSLIFSRA